MVLVKGHHFILKLLVTNTMERIILVDDEQVLAESIRDALQAAKFEVDLASDGMIGYKKITENSYDLIILDVMMPEIDGIDLCKKIRDLNIITPILFLTVNNDPEDRISGLEAGGDDYLGKPFHLKELILRVNKLIERSRWYRLIKENYEFHDNKVNFGSYELKTWDNHEHTLTYKEAMILKLLIENTNKVISREDILEKIWGYEAYPSTRTIDNFIVRLRKRLERNPEIPEHLHTVRGVGYMFTEQPKITTEKEG
jgi:two-component system, OmpR family, alkaline phosphatase synthesis response regulator PhoP